jgi:hypothetical protein
LVFISQKKMSLWEKIREFEDLMDSDQYMSIFFQRLIEDLEEIIDQQIINDHRNSIKD